MATIQRCLKRIRDTTGLAPSALDDCDKQDIFVLVDLENFYVAVLRRFGYAT